MINRSTCREDGCDRLVAFKGRAYGKVTYRAICEYHRRPARSTVQRRESSYIPNKKCEQCGWEGDCHRHRLGNPDRRYTKDNVIVLCPNCHQKAHIL